MNSTSLSLDYFYAHESEQFTFFSIPKALIADERYKPLSSDAKVLYGLMLDRMGLSVKNGWLDEDNRVFIYYPLERACSDLNRSKNKLTALFKELVSIGLIVKKRQGLGKPDMVYVMNFSGAGGCETRFPNPVNLELHGLGTRNHKACDSLTRKNKTEMSNTEFSKTNPSIHQTDRYDGWNGGGITEFEQLEQAVAQQIYLDSFLSERDGAGQLTYKPELIRAVFTVMVELLAHTGESIYIDGGNVSAELVYTLPIYITDTSHKRKCSD